MLKLHLAKELHSKEIAPPIIAELLTNTLLDILISVLNKLMAPPFDLDISPFCLKDEFDKELTLLSIILKDSLLWVILTELIDETSDRYILNIIWGIPVRVMFSIWILFWSCNSY